MSRTRQSAHIWSRRKAGPAPNIEWLLRRPSMLSIICRVPKGFAQRTQLNGSASFSTTGVFASGREEQARRQRDRVFRTGLHAQAALHAIALDELELRRLFRIEQRARRTRAHARHAQRARLAVHFDAPVRRAGGKRNRIGTHRRMLREVIEREIERAPLFVREVEGRRRHRVARREPPHRSFPAPPRRRPRSGADARRHSRAL